MTDIPLKYARFPFHTDAQDISRNLSTEEMLREEVRERAVTRIISSLNTPRVGAEHDDATIEFLSYPLARILVSLLSEYRVTKRYVAAEANTRMAMLKNDDSDTMSIDDLIVEFGVDIRELTPNDVISRSTVVSDWDNLSAEERITRVKTLRGWSTVSGSIAEYDSPEDAVLVGVRDANFGPNYTIDLNSFLTHSDDGSTWKLTNRQMIAGDVLISSEERDTVVMNAMIAKMADPLPLDVNESLSEELSEELERISDAIPEELYTADIDRVEEGLFPPVIKHLISKSQARENIIHDARVSLAAFLIRIGMNDEEIVELLGWDNEIARYQLNHVRTKGGDGEAYMVANYETLESWGLDWEKDALEASVKNPLVYYRIKLNSEGEDSSKQDDESDDESEES